MAQAAAGRRRAKDEGTDGAKAKDEGTGGDKPDAASGSRTGRKGWGWGKKKSTASDSKSDKVPDKSKPTSGSGSGGLWGRKSSSSKSKWGGGGWLSKRARAKDDQTALNDQSNGGPQTSEDQEPELNGVDSTNADNSNGSGSKSKRVWWRFGRGRKRIVFKL